MEGAPIFEGQYSNPTNAGVLPRIMVAFMMTLQYDSSNA
jgi:hypothetical protein